MLFDSYWSTGNEHARVNGSGEDTARAENSMISILAVMPLPQNQESQELAS